MDYYDDCRPLQERMEETEEKIIKYIKEYINNYGYSPTVREIKGHIGFGSTSTAYSYLLRLKNKGLVSWEPKHLRTLTINDKSSVN